MKNNTYDLDYSTHFYYKLDKNNNVIPCDRLEAWADREKPGRHIKNLFINNYFISTVFLGIKMYGGMFFETMVFDDEINPNADLLCRRYRTYDEAVKGHDRIVKVIQYLLDRKRRREKII
jgi:hypothetical protein